MFFLRISAFVFCCRYYCTDLERLFWFSCHIMGIKWWPGGHMHAVTSSESDQWPCPSSCPGARSERESCSERTILWNLVGRAVMWTGSSPAIHARRCGNALPALLWTTDHLSPAQPNQCYVPVWVWLQSADVQSALSAHNRSISDWGGTSLSCHHHNCGRLGKAHLCHVNITSMDD